ncbi:MAG: VWA domain-containing protein [Pseudomonadota bacterium]
MLIRLPSRAGVFCKSFSRDERGVTAVTFAIGFAAFALAAGIAIDYGRIINDKMRDQRAVDTAVLAAADRLGFDDQDASGKARAEAFYAANRLNNPSSTIEDVTLNSSTGEVSARTQTNWQATLLKGLDQFFPGIGSDRQISVGATVAKGSGTVELALVLDNSGSMSGSHIQDLRTAATDLAKTVFAGVEGTDRVKVGVVPFAASVNVGPQNRTASWIDTGGIGPTHSENFAEPRNRFDLFSEVGQSWAGCVEARPNGLDVKDRKPDTGVPKSMFVPMFAPDEPGEAGSPRSGYNNSYLDDDGGQCQRYDRVCLSYSRRGNCTSWQTVRLPDDQAQARTCKYFGQNRSGGYGPNYMCTTQPLLPLNATRSDVEYAISRMQASGNTNIKEGIAWGWRVLSRRAPFTEGRGNRDDNNRKIMIIMTDGENWYNTQSSLNKSVYAAQGYASKGRLGSTYSHAGYTADLNAKTRAVCDNAKADGVTIYSIAFRLENDPVTQALLSHCASGGDNFFKASNGAALIQSFQNIGREISEVRIAG